MKNCYKLFLISTMLLGLGWSSALLKGSNGCTDEECITTKKRNGWRQRGYASTSTRRARKHKRWATWAVRDQPDYHNEDPTAGRATMREGTNGVTFSARKMTV